MERLKQKKRRPTTTVRPKKKRNEAEEEKRGGRRYISRRAQLSPVARSLESSFFSNFIYLSFFFLPFFYFPREKQSIFCFFFVFCSLEFFSFFWQKNKYIIRSVRFSVYGNPSSPFWVIAICKSSVTWSMTQFLQKNWLDNKKEVANCSNYKKFLIFENEKKWSASEMEISAIGRWL